MQRTLRFFFLTLLFVAGQSYADALVWEATKGEHKVIVAGTIHLLKPADYPLSEEYPQAFADADTLVFETDMAAVQAPAFATKMTQMMMLPAGESLQTRLSPEVYERLSQFAQQRSFPLAQLQTFEPAFVALTLSIMEMQKLGFAEGVDARYTRMANEQGKQLAWLETPDEQLQFLRAMTELNADNFMRYTLDDLADLPQLMDDMVKAFKTGDHQALFELGGEPMQEYSQDLYNTILRDRNRAWISQVNEFVKTPETEMIMVGALHLAGPDSVIEMLRQEGYQVKRY
ncbi:TraB/GumN family protein [Gilvimarinus xylanilyticus]|uniref:TraB/GumN family protein n=1 Tax=Gilvimarinus xylanilyticus TaxID=2944139 RepID=A0A9X2KTR1_9GAMM|nr:TraB/GumN family protein [Gilvimarinus xylanilyticus]MCP8899457.1 TraB/GumN family protein [Gilvimarinus xylanilyticus]